MTSTAGAALAALLAATAPALAAEKSAAPADPFRQLDAEAWPPPSDYRNASGAPGHRYWQQRASYRIEVELDEEKRAVSGRARVSYVNNSPDTLTFVWMMLDQPFARNAVSELSRTAPAEDKIDLAEVRRIKRMQTWSGGLSDFQVRDVAGAPLKFLVADSVMRVDLPVPLKPSETLELALSWSYPLNETKVVWGRGGYECFEGPGEGGDCIFELSQWFPRMTVYSDYEGWHTKGFVSSEYALELGDYEVALTVPADHVVAATGVLQNPEEVLTQAQRARLEQARTATAPVYVVTPAEARAAEGSRTSRRKTWRFRAQNVRDFAAASSRKYIWDAMGVGQDDPETPVVMAMSFYANEARPLWNTYATKAIAHTLKVFGELAFPYPYPVAQAAFGPVGGMEYPMLSFIGNRPERDPKTGALTYSQRAKNGFLDNIFHEVGHNWFPMIVNSDERRWGWMDEGLTSYVQFQAEKLWDPAFPSRRGEPRDIAEPMLGADQVPVMTQPDSVENGGLVSYSKPAAALAILRETVLGRERFDAAFREYARRWRFKRPTPADFFRTMEDASGMDLDWYWRGWFYSTDHVDIALSRVVEGRLDTGDPDVEAAERRARAAEEPASVTVSRNDAAGEIGRDRTLQDFYTLVDRHMPTVREREAYAQAQSKLKPEERAALKTKDRFYRFTFENLGGVIMPVILKLSFEDGSTVTVHLPAEIWRHDPRTVTWQYATLKKLRGAEVDPLWQTGDSDRANNRFPRAIEPVTLQVEPDLPPPNRMKDSDLAVSPDSVSTSPEKPR